MSKQNKIKVINKEDIGTFNITFKTTLEHYNQILNVLNQNVDVISDSVVPDTKELYNNDDYFKKLVKAEKEARINKLNYINKHNV